MRSHCVRLATVVALLAVALTSGTARATAAGPPVSNIVRTVLGAQKTAVIFVKWDNVADTFSPQSASDRLYDP